MSKRNQTTCHCESYAFPHREFSGKCEGDLSDCTCRMSIVGPMDLEPPELKRDPWCPLHGHRDADVERDRWIDNEMENGRTR